MINITDWIAVIPPEDKTIAYVGEHESVTRQFFLPDPTYRDHTFYLDMAFDLSTVTSEKTPKQIVSTQQSMSETATEEGLKVSATENIRKESYTEGGEVVNCASKTDIAPLVKTVREDGLLLTWTVFNQQTQLPGPLRATLRAVSPKGAVKKSAVMVFVVAPSVAAEPAAPIKITEYEQMEKAMEAALAAAAADTYDAFAAKVDSASGGLRAYVDEKASPATATTFGTVKVVKGHSEAQRTTGINMLADGLIQVVGASKEQIDERWVDSAPITPCNLVYAVRSVGDGYYALADEVNSVRDACAAASTAASLYTDQKTAPANSMNYGTVKVWTNSNVAEVGGGIYMDEEGVLRLVSASEVNIDMRLHTAPITPQNLDYAVKSVGDGYYAKVGEAGGETWRLIRDDTLTEAAGVYKVTADADGNAFALKKVMIEVYADTTEGVYPSTGNLIFSLCQGNYDKNWAKTLWSTAPFPTTEGKCSYVRFDAEVIGTNAFTTVSSQKNVDGFGYTQLGAATGVSRSQAFPLNRDNIGMFQLSYGGSGGLHIGTRIVVWGVDA